ncbi:hypothetical protein GMDG_06467 [Pseudogymnoascus destructans 20631-21]|uniref:Uncharacterized protein n=1 Tax=Pseudogymnoascus destructans (strain ATCC MYA-4855 / 20631-21) TaxID=658429 RepID=L8FTQ9_PSED2|nr:hypothetical protein GMDG_06467 [Pseudogymnoascus destructans 20631-21]
MKIATILGLAGTAAAHGYVSSIVADGVTTSGWLISYWYDLVNGIPIPQTPGWYEEALDLGFRPQHRLPQECSQNVSATVAAGGSVKFQWTARPHNTGPVLT